MSCKQACNEAKKAEGDAKMRLFENFYEKLGSKSGEKNNYKLEKWREKKTRDFSQIKYIKLIKNDN